MLLDPPLPLTEPLPLFPAVAVRDPRLGVEVEPPKIEKVKKMLDR